MGAVELLLDSTIRVCVFPFIGLILFATKSHPVLFRVKDQLLQFSSDFYRRGNMLYC